MCLAALQRLESGSPFDVNTLRQSAAGYAQPQPLSGLSLSPQRDAAGEVHRASAHPANTHIMFHKYDSVQRGEEGLSLL